LKISGDLYFGAVNHIEEEILAHLERNPTQRFLLLRMHGVNQCDFSGIHMLETIRRSCQDRGGDIYFMKVQQPVMNLMKVTGFYDEIGPQHFLVEEEAIGYIFYKLMDPSICIYECTVRAWIECQNLPKQTDAFAIPLRTKIPSEEIVEIEPEQLWKKLRNGDTIYQVIDVREQREFDRGHVPYAQLLPLPTLLANGHDLPTDKEIVFVCRGGRRSKRAAQALLDKGQRNVAVLQGGMLAWEAAGLLEAIEV
ncbi:MAG: rhodanese-like domain-containing protein, partial [Anaerolineae bacterium]|nr:rhodanese-like domain-containing protein [Anaerolineae bacterium]